MFAYHVIASIFNYENFIIKKKKELFKSNKNFKKII